MIFLKNKTVFVSQVAGIFGLLLGFLLLFPNLLLAAAGDEGRAAGISLRLDPSARSSALGSAYSGRFNDPVAVHFNPASLGVQSYTQSSFTYFQLVKDIDFNHVSLVTPIVDNKAGVGLSLATVDFGSLQKTTVSPARNPIRGGSFEANDLTASGSLGFSLTDSLKGGFTGTYFQSTISEFNASTFSGDVGLQYHIVDRKFTIGLAARNLGGQLKFIEEEDPLPTVYDLGFYSSWPSRNGTDRMNLGGSVVFPMDADSYFALGLEYAFYRTLFMRLGFNGSQEAGDGFTIGAGIHDERFKVDYSYVPMGELGNQQRLSISYVFGGVEEPPEESPPVRKDTPKSDLSKLLEREENYPYLKPYPSAPWLETYQMGKSAYRNGNYAKARQFFLQAYNSNPGNVENLLWLGTMEWYLGLNEKAIKRMNQVLSVDPSNNVARRNLRRMKNEMNSDQE